MDDSREEKLFVEPDNENASLEVSDAEILLEYIDRTAHEPRPAVIFSRPDCSHCARAKALLDAKGVSYDEIRLGNESATSTPGVVFRHDSDPWPQVFVGGARAVTTPPSDVRGTFESPPLWPFGVGVWW